jgi:hypothetical protein
MLFDRSAVLIPEGKGMYDSAKRYMNTGMKYARPVGPQQLRKESLSEETLAQQVRYQSRGPTSIPEAEYEADTQWNHSENDPNQ